MCGPHLGCEGHARGSHEKSRAGPCAGHAGGFPALSGAAYSTPPVSEMDFVRKGVENVDFGAFPDKASKILLLAYLGIKSMGAE